LSFCGTGVFRVDAPPAQTASGALMTAVGFAWFPVGP